LHFQRYTINNSLVSSTIFDNALINKVDEIYVTIFDKRDEQRRLIDLLEQWGFALWGKKKEELVYMRDFSRKIDFENLKHTYPYISRDRDKILSVTAYDQLRYLKNKDIYHYENKKASEVLKMIADDFKLNCGEIEDTKYVIRERLEDNVALFDVILTALNLTLQNTKRLYVIYDDFGKITLKGVESLKLNEGIFIDETISEKVEEIEEEIEEEVEEVAKKVEEKAKEVKEKAKK